MADLMKLFSSEGKGSKSTYRPPAGTRCLVSGPNCDDDNGYVFLEMEILWSDELFVVYRTPGCWPNVNKWEHVIAKPLPSTQETVPAPEQSIVKAFEHSPRRVSETSPECTCGVARGWPHDATCPKREHD